MNELLDKIALVEFILIGVVLTTFIILYLFRSQWSRTKAGVALLVSKISLALVIYLSIITGAFGPEWPGRYYVRVIMFGAVLIAQSLLLRTLIVSQRTTLRQKKGQQSNV